MLLRWKLTHPLKHHAYKTTFLLKWSLFRGHSFIFAGCSRASYEFNGHIWQVWDCGTWAEAAKLKSGRRAEPKDRPYSDWWRCDVNPLNRRMMWLWLDSCCITLLYDVLLWLVNVNICVLYNRSIWLYMCMFWFLLNLLSIQDKGLTKAQKLFGICGTLKGVIEIENSNHTVRR